MKVNVQDAISKLLESDVKKEQVDAAVDSMLEADKVPGFPDSEENMHKASKARLFLGNIVRRETQKVAGMLGVETPKFEDAAAVEKLLMSSKAASHGGQEVVDLYRFYVDVDKKHHDDTLEEYLAAIEALDHGKELVSRIRKELGWK